MKYDISMRRCASVADFEKWFYGCPEGQTYVTRAGLIVKRSRNLRGLVDYGRTSRPVKIETRKCPDLPTCGEMRITYANGAQGFAFFRSHGIMIDFLRSRRSWRHVEFVHLDGNMGYLTKPGEIVGA